MNLKQTESINTDAHLKNVIHMQNDAVSVEFPVKKSCKRAVPGVVTPGMHLMDLSTANIKDLQYTVSPTDLYNGNAGNISGQEENIRGSIKTLDEEVSIIADKQKATDSVRFIADQGIFSRQRRFRRALRRGDFYKAAKHLRKGADVDGLDNKRKTALTEAIENGDIETAQWLVSKGGTKSRADAFYLVAKNADVNMMKCILDNNIFFYPKNEGKKDEYTIYTAINKGIVAAASWASAYSENREMVRMIIKTGWPINYWYLKSACDEVVSGCPLELVKLFVDKGVEPDFMEAVTNGRYPDVVQFLVDRGADVNQNVKEKSISYQTPLITATRFPEVVKILLDSGAETDTAHDPPALLEARRWATFPGTTKWDVRTRNDARKSETLIINKIMEKQNGEISLLNSAKYNQPENLKILLEYNVNINAKDNNGMTALMYDIYRDTLKVLLDNHIDINAKDYNGMTALMHAAINGHSSFVRQLLDNGADINAVDNNGKTALMLANEKRFRRRYCVNLLLDRGAWNPTDIQPVVIPEPDYDDSSSSSGGHGGGDTGGVGGFGW